MGGWSIDWDYEYGDIQVPTIEKEGTKWYIIIQTQVAKLNKSTRWL